MAAHSSDVGSLNAADGIDGIDSRIRAVPVDNTSGASREQKVSNSTQNDESKNSSESTNCETIDKKEYERMLVSGLRMLRDATDDVTILEALKQLRRVVSDRACAMNNDPQPFGIRVHEICTACTDLLQIAIDAEVHIQVADVLKPYLSKSPLSKCPCCCNDTEIQLLVEGLCVLTNIASGNSAQTLAITQTEILPKVMPVLFKAANIELSIECVLLINNVIADDSTTHLVEISDELLGRIFDLLHKVRTTLSEGCNGKHCVTCKASLESQVQLFHLFTSIFKSKRPVPDNHFKRILVTCCAMLNAHDEVLQELLEVLFKSSDGYGDKFIQIITNYGYVPDIVKLLNHDCGVVRKKVIYIVGNLMLGADELTWKILRSSLFIYLPSLLYSTKDTVSQVLWILSNIVAGQCEMLECLFDFDLWPYVVYCLDSKDGPVMYEAMWVVNNFMDNATKDQQNRLLCFDKYDVVAAIIPHITMDTLCLTNKDIAVYSIMDLVMECFEKLLNFVSYYISSVEGEYDNIAKCPELSDIFKLLKSDTLKSNMAQIIDEMEFDHKVNYNNDVLSDILSREKDRVFN